MLKVSLNEALVEVSESQKAQDILYRLWCFLFDYRFDFFWVYFDAIGGDNKSKESCFSDGEFAFLRFDKESFLGEFGKDFADLFLVFLL